MLTQEQWQLLFGPYALLVAAVVVAGVLWRAHTKSDDAQLAAANKRGDEWKTIAEAKTTENDELRGSLDGLTKAVNEAIPRLTGRRGASG